MAASIQSVLVTGASAGIGLALVKQIALEHGCHVYLGSRNETKGKGCVDAILKANPELKGRVELLVLDVGQDESIKAAAAKLSGKKLYALVNNAGVGASADTATILNTNFSGVRRMCEAFIPLLDSTNGRIVNVASAAGPMYIQKRGSATPEQKAALLDLGVTMKQIEEIVALERANKISGWEAYALSKAALNAYTIILARQHPKLAINSCTPGFILTNMTKSMGASKPPEEGTVSIRHLLFGKLDGNGWYYGSDGKRSPLHIVRNPGEIVYTGPLPVKHVLVTGGNTGIGFALCRQLAADHGCHVYLGSRSIPKGEKAVAAILNRHPGVKVELIQVDVSSDESVKAAAAKVKAKGVTLYGVVNNAGAGLAHPGVSVTDIFNVNLHGVKRMCAAFLPLLDHWTGRFVNVGSGAGPMYVSGRFKSALTSDERHVLANPDITLGQIDALVAKESAAGLHPHTAYGLSKAAVAAYTVVLARNHGHILSSSCTPGFIKTGITKGMNAKLTPDQGTVSLKRALLSPLGGNGFYFGSDGKRSPLHVLRNPGEPEYNPFSFKEY